MTTKNIRSNNGNNSSSTSTTTLGRYRINKERAVRTVARAYDFLNPTEDFIGIIECKGNIRHIEKRGEMKQDLDVIDCKVIVGYQTREVEEETENGLLIRRKEEKYNEQDVSLVLSKAVLYSKFKKLQEELKNLEGKYIVIVGLGKAEDKNYYDYYVETEEKAKADGIIQEINEL